MLLAPLKLAIGLVLVVVVAAAVGFLALRGRVTPDSLGHSLASVTGAATWGPCRGGGSRWRCRISDGSRGRTYRVTTDGRCWTARRVGSGGPGLPRAPRGCVGVWDQLRLL